MTIQIMRVGLTPIVRQEYYWSIDDGSAVRSGFVDIDLTGSWADQADVALPSGWERLSDWDIVGEHAVAHVRPVTRAAKSRVNTEFPSLRASHKRETERALSSLFGKMRSDVNARHDDGVRKLISARWKDDLAALLLERNLATASDVAAKVADALNSDYDPEIMRAWFESNAGIASDDITSHAESDIRDAEDRDDVDDPVGHVFGILESSGSAGLAASMVTTAAGFGARDAAEKSGAAAKVWQVNSGNPRSSHAAMNGETVGIDESFSNGMQWPGDPDGGADENAQCQCSLTIIN